MKSRMKSILLAMFVSYFLIACGSSVDMQSKQQSYTPNPFGNPTGEVKLPTPPPENPRENLPEPRVDLCTTNKDCGKNGYCVTNTCGAKGYCKNIPSSCNIKELVVGKYCSCDGEAFDTVCEAAKLGIHASSDNCK